MQIQSGIVKYKDRTDLMCTYGIADDGKQYYFMSNPLVNGNIIVTTELVEAIDPLVKISHVGLINADGRVVIPFENKAIKIIADGILLVEKAEAESETVKAALNSKNDPLEAARLVTNSANIKEKMNAAMGMGGRFVFNDQFSEASIFDFDGNNLVDDEYYSFIGINNDKLYLNKNVADEQIREYSLLKTNSVNNESTENNDIKVDSNIETAASTEGINTPDTEATNKEMIGSNTGEVELDKNLVNGEDNNTLNNSVDEEQTINLEKILPQDESIVDENVVNNENSEKVEEPINLAADEISSFDNSEQNSVNEDSLEMAETTPLDVSEEVNLNENTVSAEETTEADLNENTVSAEEVEKTVANNDISTEEQEENDEEQNLSDLIIPQDTDEMDDDNLMRSEKSELENDDFSLKDDNLENFKTELDFNDIENDSKIDFDNELSKGNIYEDVNYNDNSFSSMDFDSDTSSIIEDAARYVANSAKVNKEQARALAEAREAYKVLKGRAEKKFDEYSEEINELKRQIQKYEQTISEHTELLKRQKAIIAQQNKENSNLKKQLKGTVMLRRAMEEASRFLNDDDDDYDYSHKKIA